MTKQEQLQKVEEKIRSILDILEKETNISEIIHQTTLFEFYMDKRQELKKQLKQ